MLVRSNIVSHITIKNKICCACNKGKAIYKISDKLNYNALFDKEGWLVTVCNKKECFEYVKLLYC